jgi:hypothetical protein
MTDAANPVSRRIGARWGHFAPELLIVSIIGLILFRIRPPADPAASLGASLALVAFVLTTWVQMRKHDRSLCENCVSSMPLNPSAAAERYKSRFWLAHNGAQPRYAIPYLVVLISSNFATGSVGLLFWTLMQSSMIFLILSYSTHRRLQPWCPWCSEDGGGEDDVPVGPDPVPGDRRQRI